MGQAWHLHQNDESEGQNALVMRICSFPVTSVTCNVPQFVAQGSGA